MERSCSMHLRTTLERYSIARFQYNSEDPHYDTTLKTETVNPAKHSSPFPRLHDVTPS